LSLGLEVESVDKELKGESKSASWGLWAGLLVGGMIGAFLAVWIKQNVNQLAESGLARNQLVQQLSKSNEILTAWDVLAIPVLILIVLGTHEIGHVLSGLSQGMRFLMLIVGPFGWYTSASGVRFEWNTNLALMGGLAGTMLTLRSMGGCLRIVSLRIRRALSNLSMLSLLSARGWLVMRTQLNGI
jgi:hypothetical protein